MSFSRRVKSFFTARKGGMRSKGLEVAMKSPTDEKKDPDEMGVVPLINPISREAEIVLPQLLVDAIHHPEVLALRPSLVPGFHSGNLLAPPSPGGLSTPSGDSPRHALFITNGDSYAQSFSTAVTSMRSASSLDTMASSESSSPTLHLHDFLHVRGIGMGGFASVHLVKYRPTGMLVALKVFEKRDCDQKVLKNERKMLGMIATSGTKGIIEFLGSFHDSRHYFMVTSYYPKGDLKMLIARWKVLPPALAKHYAAELLLALNALHTQGILHRDIKPDNIFISDDDHLIIGDLGLSRPITPPGQTFVPGEFCNWRVNEMAGTLVYLSPEMWKGDPYDFSVDVWAYGCTVFEMVFGRTPWTGSIRDSVSKLERHVLQDTLDDYLTGEKPSKVTKLFFDGLFQKNPYYRPTLDEAKSHAFFKGISWKKLEKGELPVPKIGTPPPAPQEMERDLFFGSIGGGGVYIGDEDPCPEFNYVSPKLVPEEPCVHTHRLRKAASPTIAPDSDTDPTAPIGSAPSPSDSFEEVDLNSDAGSSTTSLLPPGESGLTSCCNPPEVLSPTAIVVTTVTTVATVEEDFAAPSASDQAETVSSSPVARVEEFSPGSPATEISVAVFDKPPSFMRRFKTFINRILAGLTKICSLLPPLY